MVLSYEELRNERWTSEKFRTYETVIYLCSLREQTSGEFVESVGHLSINVTIYFRAKNRLMFGTARRLLFQKMIT